MRGTAHAVRAASPIGQPTGDTGGFHLRARADLAVGQRVEGGESEGLGL
jgi:hypothetical protein